MVGSGVTAKDFDAGEAAGAAVIDADGSHPIGGLQAGDYSVEVDASGPGFVPQCCQEEDLC